MAERDRFIEDWLAGRLGSTLSDARWRTIGCSSFWLTSWRRWRTGYTCDGTDGSRSSADGAAESMSVEVLRRAGPTQHSSGRSNTAAIPHPPTCGVVACRTLNLGNSEAAMRVLSETGIHGRYLLPILHPKNSSGSSGTRTQRTFVAFRGSCI